MYTTSDDAPLVTLRAGHYLLEICPAQGGKVTRFGWRDQALFRPAEGRGILQSACFPLVPFCGRVRNGVFLSDGKEVRLAPNFPGRDDPDSLHGFGWQSRWRSKARHNWALLVHEWSDGAWPWAYHATQRFDLSVDGLLVTMAVRNNSSSAMPAGLGLHPYFPDPQGCFYRAFHRREWRLDAHGVAITADERDAPIDWWNAQTIASRCVDTAYSGRTGALDLHWPARGLGLKVQPDDLFDFTVVYTPEHSAYFCVEPQSHRVGALNEQGPDDGIVWLSSGETLTGQIRFSAYAVS